MKRLLFTLTLLCTTFSYTQDHYIFCFEQQDNCLNNSNLNDTSCTLSIETISNINNIWQIGSPQKNNLSTSVSQPKVIITDTINPYPISDTSSFITQLPVSNSTSSSVHWTYVELSFDFYVDSDTLTDFGQIELSLDSGTTWINILNDPLYLSYINWSVNSINGTNLNNMPPVLTGTSGGWMNAYADLAQLTSFLNVPSGNTVQYKFTFISDANQTNRDGLMYDNITLIRTPPIGVDEELLHLNKTLIKIVDVMGRETEDTPNTTLIYMYSDGTTKKVFRVE
jgi:bacillopeptidase F (M6 metalloprotease family)